jgi:hypothetical protein
MAKRISLFKLLRRELGPQLTAQGYTEVPQSASQRTHILSYFSEASRGPSLGFWFQRDVKAHCVDALGSSFTLEFFRALENPFALDGRKRGYFMLTASELEEMRLLQNNVIKRLPPPEAVLNPGERKIFKRSLEKGRRAIEDAFNPRHDVWMRYRDEEDILAWTSFIGRLLPTLAERFAALPSRT